LHGPARTPDGPETQYKRPHLADPIKPQPRIDCTYLIGGKAAYLSVIFWCERFSTVTSS